MKRGYVHVVVFSLLFLSGFLVYPLLFTIKGAIFPNGEFSMQLFKLMWSNPVIRGSVWNSFMIATVATFLCALIAVPVAAATVRCSFPFKTLLSLLLLVPMIMPPFVGAIGMKQMLARFGSINLLLLQTGLLEHPIDWLGSARFWGVVIVEVLHLYPIFYLNAAASIGNVDPALEDAAINLGSSSFRTFRKITLPLMMPGLFAGSVVVFIWAFTDLGTPLIFEYRAVVPVQIFDRINDVDQNYEGHVLVFFVLLLTLAFYMAGKRFFGSAKTEMMSRGISARPLVTLNPIAGSLTALAIGTLILISCIPHIAVILTSVSERWYLTILPDKYSVRFFEQALSHELALPSIRNSIMLSSASTFFDIIIGVAIAWVLARRRFRGIDLFDSFVMLPLAVPGLILAFGYVVGFKNTMIDPSVNPFPLLIAAYSVRRLPYMVRTAYSGFQQISVAFEEAAVNLGSTTIRAVRRITIPLISANIIGGAILAFSFAMLEVSDSIILAIQERFYPITKAIYQLQGRIEDGIGMSSALGVWSMVFLAVSLLLAGALLGKKIGQIFRI